MLKRTALIDLSAVTVCACGEESRPAAVALIFVAVAAFTLVIAPTPALEADERSTLDYDILVDEVATNLHL